MKIIFAFLVAGLSFTAHAQEHYMSLCFSGSSPLGNFVATSDLQTDGFALNGFGGEYAGTFFISKFIGFGGNIRYTSNTISDNEVRQLLREEIPEDFPVENVQLGIGLWKQVSFVAGPYFSLPFETFSLDAYTLIGFNFIMPPDMKISAVIDDETYFRNISVQSVSYALDLGLAVRYHLNDRYSLRLFAAYFQSKAKGKIKEEIDLEGDGIPDINETDQTMTIQSINYGIGIVYRL
ncbi:MAG: hypothetical protein PVF73_06255 [Bacteroidales bacterium]|jgi:hypothetical protein